MRLDPRYPPPQDPELPGRCAGCRLPPVACFCAEIRAIPTRLHVVIVRHVRELWRSSNTGRIAAMALENCTLLDFGAFTPTGGPQALDVAPLVTAGARVLAPGAPGSVEGVDTLFVLDGTWSQVRSMRARLAPLTRMPALAIPAGVAAARRMRRGNEPEQLATMEAIAAALDVVGEPEPARQLRALFDVMAQRMTDLRGFDMPAKQRR